MKYAIFSWLANSDQPIIWYTRIGQSKELALKLRMMKNPIPYQKKTTIQFETKILYVQQISSVRKKQKTIQTLKNSTHLQKY